MAAILAASNAAALGTRADREDAEYLELASRYASTTALGANAGEAVLIAPRWLLTSAARAKALKPGAALTAGGRAHEIQSVYLHPAWNGARDSALALVLLREAVEGVEPTPIYRGRDEDGRTCAIAAHGGDGRARAGVNTIEAVTAASFATRIKGADDASDLQGTLTANETGAPAFVEVRDDVFVAGIAVDLDDANRNGRTGDVGDRELFARVSTFADWIDATMFRAGADEAAAATTRAAPRKAK